MQSAKFLEFYENGYIYSKLDKVSGEELTVQTLLPLSRWLLFPRFDMLKTKAKLQDLLRALCLSPSLCVCVCVSHVDKAIKEKKIIVNVVVVVFVVVSGTLWMRMRWGRE